MERLSWRGVQIDVPLTQFSATWGVRGRPPDLFPDPRSPSRLLTEHAHWEGHRRSHSACLNSVCHLPPELSCCLQSQPLSLHAPHLPALQVQSSDVCQSLQCICFLTISFYFHFRHHPFTDAHFTLLTLIASDFSPSTAAPQLRVNSPTVTSETFQSVLSDNKHKFQAPKYVRKHPFPSGLCISACANPIVFLPKAICRLMYLLPKFQWHFFSQK